jgi:hypothetical protein
VNLRNRLARLARLERARRYSPRPERVQDMTDRQLAEILAADLGLTPAEVLALSDAELAAIAAGKPGRP